MTAGGRRRSGRNLEARPSQEHSTIGRPSDFTSAEDAIIARLHGHTAELTNAALALEGFEPRSPSKISQRRYYLRRRAQAATTSDQSAVIRLERRRLDIERRLQRAEATVDSLRAELDVVTSELTATAASIASKAQR